MSHFLRQKLLQRHRGQKQPCNNCADVKRNYEKKKKKKRSGNQVNKTEDVTVRSVPTLRGYSSANSCCFRPQISLVSNFIIILAPRHFCLSLAWRTTSLRGGKPVSWFGLRSRKISLRPRVLLLRGRSNQTANRNISVKDKRECGFCLAPAGCERQQQGRAGESDMLNGSLGRWWQHAAQLTSQLTWTLTVRLSDATQQAVPRFTLLSDTSRGPGQSQQSTAESLLKKTQKAPFPEMWHPHSLSQGFLQCVVRQLRSQRFKQVVAYICSSGWISFLQNLSWILTQISEIKIRPPVWLTRLEHTLQRRLLQLILQIQFTRRLLLLDRHVA